MGLFAAVMTGRGVGAISTIQVFGEDSKTVIKKIFKPAGAISTALEPGSICLGAIRNGSETIDQVIIGCEGKNSFTINCHGNPLIVADIMQLLNRNGGKLLTAEELSAKILSAEKPLNTIELEAKLNFPKARTLQGVKIIANQINTALSKKTTEWLQNSNSISLDTIKSDAEHILDASQTAKLIIYGCKIAIVGPPYTGKSTLLNYLAGRQKAIVTGIKGTTRDWVSAQCQIGPLAAELIDTAGLDEQLSAAAKDNIEKASQQKTVQILEKADLLLLVLDSSQAINQLDKNLLKKITGRKILTVLNKSDLPCKLNPDKLPQTLTNTVKISAKLGTGIENLLKQIQQACGVADFDLHTPVCITSRQENLLEQLKKTKSKKQASSIITELLNGPLRV